MDLVLRNLKILLLTVLLPLPVFGGIRPESVPLPELVLVQAEADDTTDPIPLPLKITPTRVGRIAATAGGVKIPIEPSYEGDIDVGDLLILDATGSDAQVLTWKLVGGTSKNYAVFEEGRKVSFSSKSAGTYTFIIAGATNGTGDGEPPSQSMVEYVVRVKGTAPGPRPPGPEPPGPGPEPPGPVTPVIPPENDKYGLATVAYKAGVNTRSNIAGARITGFADNFASVAAQIAAGTIRTVADMNAKLKQKNKDMSGTDTQKYADLLIIPISKKMQSLGLTTMEQHQVALDEIAYGLFLAAEN